MKKLVTRLLVCGFASAIMASSASAAVVYLFTLDENGNALLSGGGQSAPVAGAINVDPISGQEGLFYNTGPLLAALGVTDTQGDVTMTGQSGVEDLIRFVNAGGLHGIFFFSLIDPSDPGETLKLADVDTLPDATGNGPVFNILEVAGSGLWVPTSGQPGFVPQAPNVVGYRFDSDPIIPEPSTFALFGVAGGMLALFWRQRSGRA